MPQLILRLIRKPSVYIGATIGFHFKTVSIVPMMRADALAEAVRSAIARSRTAIAGRPVFFVSGGADSRVMLFCTRDRSRVVGINLYEREASEPQVARKLCEVAGL